MNWQNIKDDLYANAFILIYRAGYPLVFLGIFLMAIPALFTSVSEANVPLAAFLIIFSCIALAMGIICIIHWHPREYWMRYRYAFYYDGSKVNYESLTNYMNKNGIRWRHYGHSYDAISVSESYEMKEVRVTRLEDLALLQMKF